MDVRTKEIYKDLNSSIKDTRKREDDVESIFQRKKKERIEPKPEFSEMEMKEAGTENMPEESESSKEEEKIGFLSFMANLFKKKREENIEDIEEGEESFTKIELYKPQMEEDVRKVLKIADDMIKKVPNFELRKFMQSKEYEAYESIIKKYGLR